MGQFGNQPDFGTQAIGITPTGECSDPTTGIRIDPPCALYVGTGGDLLVSIVGGNEEYYPNATWFTNIPSGTFLPIMVNYVWSEGYYSTLTTAANIIGLR